MFRIIDYFPWCHHLFKGRYWAVIKETDFKRNLFLSRIRKKMFSCINTVIVYGWPVRELAVYVFSLSIAFSHC